MTSKAGPFAGIAAVSLAIGMMALPGIGTAQQGEQVVTIGDADLYAKGFDGCIDDPDAGWKGRSLWLTSGDRTPWLMEGGKGSRPRAVHVQIRPDPLAR